MHTLSGVLKLLHLTFIISIPKRSVHIKVALCGILPREINSHDLSYELRAKLGIVPEVDSRTRALLKLGSTVIRKGEAVALHLVAVHPEALDRVVKTARLANYGNCSVARSDHLRESAGLAL